MAKKTPREAIDSALKRLKAEPPITWSADPSSPMHENVQRVVNSGLNAADVFDAEVKGLEHPGIFVVAKTSPIAMSDSKPWLELFRWSDIEATLGVTDLGSEDPMVVRARMDEHWDDGKSIPKPEGLRPVCRLSELVAKFKRRPAPKKGTSRFTSSAITVRAGDGPSRYLLDVQGAGATILAVGHQGQVTKLEAGVATPIGAVPHQGQRAALDVGGRLRVVVADWGGTLRVMGGEPLAITRVFELGNQHWIVTAAESKIVLRGEGKLVSCDVETGERREVRITSNRQPLAAGGAIVVVETEADGGTFLSSFSIGLERLVRAELPRDVRWAEYEAVASRSAIAIPGEKQIAVVREGAVRLIDVRWSYKLALTETTLIAHDEGARLFQAFDVADGRERWRVTSSTKGATSYRGRELRLIGSTLLAISEDGVIDAIDVESGTLRWSVVLPLTKAEHVREDAVRQTLAEVPGGIVIVPRRHNSHAACAFFVDLADGKIERVPHPEVIGVIADGPSFWTWSVSAEGGMTTVLRWT